jgi:hypothetical protein
MNDGDGPAIATTVYQELYRGDLLNLDAIPFALDSAVRKMRECGLPPSRWASYVHMGC